MEYCGKIQRDDGVPELVRKVFVQVGVLNAGVIDQNIDTAQSLYRRVDEFARRARLRQVGIDVVGFHIELQLDIDPFFFDSGGVAKTVVYHRSEERRLGYECVSKCRLRCGQENLKKKKQYE